MAGRRQLIETMSHREPRGVCLHWAVSKNPNSLPLSLPLFFSFPGSRAVVQRRNHGGWDWGQAVCGSTRRLGLSHTPESQPVLSCLGPYRQSKPGRTAAHLGVVVRPVGAAGVPVMIRPIPGPTTETTDTSSCTCLSAQETNVSCMRDGLATFQVRSSENSMCHPRC